MKKLAAAATSAMVVFMAATLAVAAPSNAKKAPAAADAAASNVSGKILRVDPANQTVTLADGQYYMVPASIKLDGVKTVDQVTMIVDKDK